MKKLILLAIVLSVMSYMSAQTYNGGVWYSLYDTETHSMNTQGDYETGNIFAPTNGKLNVQWKYTWIDLFGVARKIDTKVLESADGGSNTNTVGSLSEHTDKNSDTSESFNISRNINWVKFSREGLPTHKVNVYHIDIPLAQHILLASGTYGTTQSTHDFGELNALSVSEPYTIKLRSFLSAGDITVSSSDPDVFHVGSVENTGVLVYSVGANACASANGKATVASAGTLGKISNYDVTVYFTPQIAKEYVAHITITDGTSTAKVTVSGIGLKLDQSINWEPETPILSNANIALAQATSGLDVSYSFSPEGIVTFENGAFTILKDGVVTITASQEGNAVYNAAEAVSKQITIFPKETQYSYQATICQGEKWSDENFTDLTEMNLYYDTIPNVYGGDSVICLSLIVHPTFAFEDARTIFAGTQELWQQKDLSVLPIGDTTLVAKYVSATNCDSVYSLHLTVIPRPVSYGNDTILLCAGESALYEGKTYKRPVKDSVLVSTPNQLGGDSIVELVVYVFPAMKMSSTQTMVEGESLYWQDKDLSTMPVGDTTLVAAYTSIHGCDSVYVLKLKVVKNVVTDNHSSNSITESLEKVFVNGQLYIRKSDAWYDSLGRKVKSIKR